MGWKMVISIKEEQSLMPTRTQRRGIRSELKDDQTHPEAKRKHLWVHENSAVWCASKVYLSFCLLSSVNITTISMALITHGCFHEKTTQLHENYFLLHTFPTYTFSLGTQQLFQMKKTHKCYSPQSLQISQWTRPVMEFSMRVLISLSAVILVPQDKDPSQQEL
jgi:hypothetical protein